jgi:hypothetical protein
MKPKAKLKRVAPKGPSIEELKERLEPDRNSLDDELIQQPSLYFMVGEMLVTAISIRDAAKENLERIDAELAERIRADWTKKKIRWSETKVGDQVLMEEEHIEAKREHNGASLYVGRLQSLQASFDQKGRNLRDLVNLFIAGYFDNASAKGGKKVRDSALASTGRQSMNAARKSYRMYEKE